MSIVSVHTYLDIANIQRDPVRKLLPSVAIWLKLKDEIMASFEGKLSALITPSQWQVYKFARGPSSVSFFSGSVPLQMLQSRIEAMVKANP